jgi:hypothetical protein
LLTAAGSCAETNVAEVMNAKDMMTAEIMIRMATRKPFSPANCKPSLIHGLAPISQTVFRRKIGHQLLSTSELSASEKSV